MRMVVIENRKGEVACLQMRNPLSYYSKKYKVLAVVNKEWNPYHVSKIKEYYKNKN